MRHLLVSIPCVLLLLAGCGGRANVDYSRPMPGLEQTEVLNVQAFRNVVELELTNTTGRSFGASTLWLNQRFSRPIDGLAIGQSLKLPLREFVDEYGGRFRAGGFFATRVPDLVVLVQLENEGQLYGLLIGGNRIK